ncbi:hypothetical protein M422DRAFT_28430, partial [Sphaerobolus stellatus SS14]
MAQIRECAPSLLRTVDRLPSSIRVETSLSLPLFCALKMGPRVCTCKIDLSEDIKPGRVCPNCERPRRKDKPEEKGTFSLSARSPKTLSTQNLPYSL